MKACETALSFKVCRMSSSSNLHRRVHTRSTRLSYTVDGGRMEA